MTEPCHVKSAPANPGDPDSFYVCNRRDGIAHPGRHEAWAGNVRVKVWDRRGGEQRWDARKTHRKDWESLADWLIRSLRQGRGSE